MAAVVARAISKAHQKHGNTKTRNRWIRAISKALAFIEDNNRFIHYDEEEGTLMMWSEESDEIYSDAARCSCKANRQNKPCYHRAAARLVERYLEAERTGPFIVKTFSSNFKGLDVTEKRTFFFFDDAKDFAEVKASEPHVVTVEIFNKENSVYKIDVDEREREREPFKEPHEFTYLPPPTGKKPEQVGRIRF